MQLVNKTKWRKGGKQRISRHISNLNFPYFNVLNNILEYIKVLTKLLVQCKKILICWILEKNNHNLIPTSSFQVERFPKYDQSNIFITNLGKWRLEKKACSYKANVGQNIICIMLCDNIQNGFSWFQLWGRAKFLILAICLPTILKQVVSKDWDFIVDTLNKMLFYFSIKRTIVIAYTIVVKATRDTLRFESFKSCGLYWSERLVLKSHNYF